jgi:hypothetical protein
MPWDEDDAFLVDDDDTDIESDGDVCEKCYCPRDHHEDNAGPCQCGRCRKFKQ